ncbi:MAG: alpha-hydroxy-acid oxidizing protein [Siculibacillus sp.]|nr:alpha-hydroxy-acid oxidizing protein [Siculibacillus sp.]
MSEASEFGEIPPGVVSLGDWEAPARDRLDPGVRAYLAGHAGDGVTARRNRDAFLAAEIVPRVLLDERDAETPVDLFGRRIAMPILVAPVAHQGLFHREAERGSAMAASAVDTIFVASTLSTLPLEAIAAAADGGGQWFQLYPQADSGLTDELVARAEAVGFEALMITVDAPVFGVRNVEQRVGFRLPVELAPANLVGWARMTTSAAADGLAALLAGRPTWAEVERIIGRTRLPVLLKGILDTADAERAVAIGAAGVVVSNHGGRVLDLAPASLDRLAPIRERLGDDAVVLLDGGVRRGADVWVALRRGADAVMVGRPLIEALAVGGPLGVAHALRTLAEETAITVALAGRP